MSEKTANVIHKLNISEGLRSWYRRMFLQITKGFNIIHGEVPINIFNSPPMPPWKAMGLSLAGKNWGVSEMPDRGKWGESNLL